jgi:hypothetical protein
VRTTYGTILSTDCGRCYSDAFLNSLYLSSLRQSVVTVLAILKFITRYISIEYARGPLLVPPTSNHLIGCLMAKLSISVAVQHGSDWTQLITGCQVPFMALFFPWRDSLHEDLFSTERFSPRRSSLFGETLHGALLSPEKFSVETPSP